MESRMQQHGIKYFACILRPNPEGVVKGQNSTFSEHVAYQNKGNNNILA